MRVLYSGWLLKDDSLPWVINGIHVDPATRTRREEYHWAAGMASGNMILDAATGYVPNWHMLPYIVLRTPICRTVVACDMDPRQKDMPYHPAIVRMNGNLMCLPYLDGQFDTTFCISTLEHLEPAEQQASARELYRVTKPGGRVVITADFGSWIPALYGQPIGPHNPDEPALSPPVYAFAFIKE